MNAIDVRPATTSVYGAVQLGYALIDSPRLAEWKRFAAEGIGMALAESEPDTLAFRTDAHARRLIVRKSPTEDLALGWRISGAGALDTILGRLAARGVKVEEIGGDEAASAWGRADLALHRAEEHGIRALPRAQARRRAAQGSRQRLRDRRARHGPCRDHDP